MAAASLRRTEATVLLCILYNAIYIHFNLNLFSPMARATSEGTNQSFQGHPLPCGQHKDSKGEDLTLIFWVQLLWVGYSYTALLVSMQGCSVCWSLWEQRSWKELEGQPRPSTDVPGPPTASFLITAHFVLACLNYSFSLTKTRSPVVGGPGGYWENTEPFDARMGTSQRWFM